MRQFCCVSALLWGLLCLATPVALAQEATPVDQMVVKKGFKVERLYSVPKAEQGSWVNMCLDHKGRFIVSDQYGKLYRIDQPKAGTKKAITPEPIDLPIGQAQGLLYAFDSLYVMVANKAYDGQGLYRLKDTDGDDKFDEVKLLREMKGTGEHGPHAILLSPDKKSLHIVCGNRTALTEINESRVPQVWDEDLVLPRTYGRGFMKGVPAPGGWICRTDPNGETWELLATGFRNQYDAAFNANGDLFTYDADMEWDMNTPWYRPTRVNHVASGAEFGWRNGSGKWPAYYPDSLPAVVNIGPGSPTGVVFGYGAKFPAKYQKAFYICDWSYGKLYAVHLTPEGSGYDAKAEEFITGTPLPLTDILVHPDDGAMYFTTGGRKVQSGFYRVTYAGEESTSPAELTFESDAHALRKTLEGFHGHVDPTAVATAWPHLASEDRFLQFAARIAIEHQPVDQWEARVFAEKNARAQIAGLIALARHAKPTKNTQTRTLKALAKIEWDSLSDTEKVNLLRAYQLAFTRMGEPTEKQRDAVAERLAAVYPAKTPPQNAELTQLLVYLQSPIAAERGVKLLMEAPTQEEQINYAKSLRLLKTGWTDELREQYLAWFTRAASYRGGASFSKFVENIKKDAVANLSDAQKQQFAGILNAKPQATTPQFTNPNRKKVKEWTVDEVVSVLDEEFKKPRDFYRGRRLFGEAACFACHRFGQEGGAVGPDLTGIAGRFNRKDLTETIIHPSKEVSDQYAATTFVTTNGKIITGRIVNLSGDNYRVNTNMLNPDLMESVNVNQIEEMFPAKTSMMPTGLLDRFTADEIADLMAYLLSRANPNDPLFQKPKTLSASE